MYAVEFSHRSGRDLINVAKKRTNIIPIIEDARHPHKYRMLVGESLLIFREKGIEFYHFYVQVLYYYASQTLVTNVYMVMHKH